VRIAVWHDLPTGGGKRALFDQVRGLVERGHTVISWSPDSAALDFLPLNCEERALEISATRTSGGWRIIDSCREIVDARSALEEHCRRCVAEMEAERVDILLAHPSRQFATSPIGAASSFPSALYLQEPVRDLHEARPLPLWTTRLIGDEPLLAAARELPRRLGRLQAIRLRAQAELDFVRGFDRLLVNSRYSREVLLRTYGVEARLCRLGIDTNSFTDLGRARSRRVLGVGNYWPPKRIDFVIRSLARIDAAKRPPLRWVGNDGDLRYATHLSSLAEDTGVEFDLKWQLDEGQLRDELATAGVLAYAPRLEPFGYAPLEAAACGLATVAIAEAGVRETVRTSVNGILVDGEEDAFATALLRVLDEPGLASALQESGRRDVEENWALDRATDTLERHLVETVAGRPKRA
jgi:glycosyltransferase involved in cell wall biosynthesis